MKFSVNVSAKLLKILGVIVGLSLVVAGARFYVGFRNDYIKIHNQNELMWQYITQPLELHDHSISTRAKLLHDLLVERDK